jgi:succinoglycan biosynthesis transport protein ExoP
VVMVTSAAQGEGKSTTVANLAVALYRAGRNVVLVDLDLRRPTLDSFFGLEGRSVGLTDLARGEAKLTPIKPPDLDGPPELVGRLEVLTTGPLPKDTGEFVGSPALNRVLDELRERADIVLIDSPPLLAVGDAIALSAKVDGVIILARLNLVRRGMLDELRRILGNIPAAKLGFVVTGAEAEQENYGYRYGRYRYAYGYQAERPKRAGRRARR